MTEREIAGSTVGPDLNNLAELWVRRPALAEGALK